MYESFKSSADANLGITAVSFMGRKTTFSQLDSQIDAFARALLANGIEKGDRVSIAFPNCPQCIIAFYAVNKIGAVANMIHPLSGEKEIERFLNLAHSEVALTLDMFSDKFENVRRNTPLRTLVVSTMKDALGKLKGFAYGMSVRGKYPVNYDDGTVSWKDFVDSGKSWTDPTAADVKPLDPAVILYSGGTTGSPKGVLHCNDAFNALALQLTNTNVIVPGDKVLTLVPMFHGFGLGVSMHCFITHGMTCVLLPRYKPDDYARTLLRNRCNYLAGPPSLFESAFSSKLFRDADLGFLKGVYSGGDNLSPDMENSLSAFLLNHGSKIGVQQGYGLAESIGAVCLAPPDRKHPGTIGAPLGGMGMCVVTTGTVREAPRCEIGEICIRGPSVMLGYLDNPEATAEVFREHEDGNVWLHTGDLGYQDVNGLFYFVQRLKRMIVSNGYNIYPSQIEEVLNAHPLVKISCAIGVPDKRKGRKVKVIVVLKDGVPRDAASKKALMDCMRVNIAKYALPSSIDFADSLPLTSVGKVAYKALEEEYATDRN